MTSEPFTYNQGTAADVFAAQAASVYRQRQRKRNRYRVVRTVNEGTDNDPRWVRYWEVTFRSFAGGMGPLIQDWDDNGYNDNFAVCEGLDASIPGYLILTRDTIADAPLTPTGTFAGIHSANIFDSFFVAIGSGTNVSLLKETSASDPTLVAVTYNPTGTSSICSLSTAVVGSTTTDRRLIVGLTEDPAQIVGDASGTVDATMHADTERLWGLVQTWLPGTSGFVIQLYSGGASGAAAIRTLLTSDATGTQPTSVTPDLPNGGFAVADHEIQLSGSAPRTYWVIPKEDLSTASMLQFGAEKLGYVTSFDLYGKDPQTLAFNDMPNGVKIACAAYGYDGQLGVAASDGDQIVWHDGTREYLIPWRADRAEEMTDLGNPDINSNYRYYIRGLFARGSRLYYQVSYINPSTSSDSFNWWEFYDFTTDTIHVSNLYATNSNNSTAVQGVLASGPMPFSRQTQNIYTYSSIQDNFYYQFLPFPHENPFWVYRRSDAGSSLTGKVVETSGTLVTPQLQLPDTVGLLSCVDEIAYGGDHPATYNTDGYTRIQVGYNSGTVVTFPGTSGSGGTSAGWATFVASDRIEQRTRRNISRGHKFSKLWLRFTVNRGSAGSAATDSFHNALSVVVRGRTFL